MAAKQTRLIQSLNEEDLFERVMDALVRLDGKRGKTTGDILQELECWDFKINPKLVFETGLCHHDTKTIEIHHELMCSNTSGRVKQRIHTMVHEVAHVLVAFIYRNTKWHNIKSHGSEWRFIMRLLKENPDEPINKDLLYHYAVLNAPHIYECIGCGCKYPKKTEIIGSEVCVDCDDIGQPALLIPL